MKFICEDGQERTTLDTAICSIAKKRFILLSRHEFGKKRGRKGRGHLPRVVSRTQMRLSIQEGDMSSSVLQIPR